MDKTEKRICLYSSLLIALLVNSPKLLAIRENGIVARYWHFNLAELILQTTFNFGFCYLMLYLNLKRGNSFSVYIKEKKYFLALVFNFFLLLFACLLAGAIQKYIFYSQQRGFFWAGYLSRYFLSALLAGIMMKIILLLRGSKQKENENEQLKTAYLEAELQLLKEQLNPHFLFNSLSSLSAVVREDPVKAQQLINHLSKVFRYTLAQSGSQMATIDDELKMIRSYEQLLLMRFENAVQVNVNIDHEYLNLKIPHLSLQPLLENAAKHNSATLTKPLKIDIFVDGGLLVVKNNLQQIPDPENSTGTGLANLNSRFRILMQHEITIEKTAGSFIVKLPLNI